MLCWALGALRRGHKDQGNRVLSSVSHEVRTSGYISMINTNLWGRRSCGRSLPLHCLCGCHQPISPRLPWQSVGVYLEPKACCCYLLLAAAARCCLLPLLAIARCCCLLLPAAAARCC